MRYQPGVATKEGGYTRTGTRTPMQWSEGPNLGFSDAAPDRLYLPVDSAPDAPTVEKQTGDPASLLETVRALLALRHSQPDLNADADFEPVEIPGAPRALIYRRGSLWLTVNPSPVDIPLPEALQAPFRARACLHAIGAAQPDVLRAQSFTVWGA